MSFSYLNWNYTFFKVYFVAFLFTSMTSFISTSAFANSSRSFKNTTTSLTESTALFTSTTASLTQFINCKSHTLHSESYNKCRKENGLVVIASLTQVIESLQVEFNLSLSEVIIPASEFPNINKDVTAEEIWTQTQSEISNIQACKDSHCFESLIADILFNLMTIHLNIQKTNLKGPK